MNYDREHKHLGLRMTPFFSFENNSFLEHCFGRYKDGIKMLLLFLDHGKVFV